MKGGGGEGGGESLRWCSFAGDLTGDVPHKKQQDNQMSAAMCYKQVRTLQRTCSSILDTMTHVTLGL